ncbi:GlcG/HbpS family heme-binding protein [Pseudomonas aeruginosa]|uniref:GlcG/HbpS family heme-binding protein n=1 Tax=Pseudomonas aeruginosa TaxID=287 RepID=UPI001CD75BAD|nr:heme-binding protein [Pseudomonas aeruginosa]
MRLDVFAAVIFLFSFGSNLAHAEGSHLISTEKLDWETAQDLAAEAIRVCTSEGYAVAVTVVDPSGHQQVVIRGDKAPLQTLSVSYRKAYTAFSYGMTFDKNTTSDLIAAKVTGPSDGSLATVPQVLFIPGGVTLRKADNTVIGGIGVSGAPGGDKDEQCALEAVKKYKERFK